VIQVQGKTDLFGHSYFRSNPKVSADLIALLRYGLAPNAPGRPLVEVERPFWRIPEGQDTNASK
jgi:esterase/lipase superfamily enzyme